MVKRRKRRKPLKTKRRTIVFFFVLAAIIGAAFFLWRKRRVPPRHVRREVSRTVTHPHPISPETHERFRGAGALFRATIERAGGGDVWVRRSAGATASDFNVLVGARRYTVVERAILDAARQDGLRVRQTASPPRSAQTDSVTLTAYQANQALCRWTMREVAVIPRVSIIVDDLGQNPAAARSLLRLGSPLTFSVMPHLPYSRETAEEAHRDGIEVMLHLPMQPLDDSAPDVSAGEIKTGMGSGKVNAIVASALASVPYVAGVNNHMGSRATSDPRLMGEVMAALAPRHLYYIDSRTIATSVALKAAHRAGVPSYYRSVFLDDTRTVPYTLNQLRELCRIAARSGAAIAIGHPYPTTIAALARFLPTLERQDIQLVRVSALLRLPEIAPIESRRAQRLAGIN
ncbi:MAG: divergent polysaccharide deacetylase family protein [Terriglobia bacterium]